MQLSCVLNGKEKLKQMINYDNKISHLNDDYEYWKQENERSSNPLDDDYDKYWEDRSVFDDL